MTDDNKKFPPASQGAKEMFNMDGDNSEGGVSSSGAQLPDDLPVADLDSETDVSADEQTPKTLDQLFEDAEKEQQETKHSAQNDQTAEQNKNTDSSSEAVSFDEEAPAKPSPIVKYAKMIGPYILIFGIAIGLYFFYFSDVSINSLFNTDKLRIESLLSDVDERDANIEKLKEESSADYLDWIGQFFVDVNDSTIIDMDTDVSGNGLTNFEKYLLNLNPKVYSTRGNIGDGQAVIEDINPWTGEKFTDSQKELVDMYINRELISNRITAAALTRGVTKFAQYVEEDSPYYIEPEVLEEMAYRNTIITAPENISPRDGNQPVQVQPVIGAPPQPASAVGLNSEEAIDQTKNGQLDIPAYGISVPLVWTQDVKDFDEDLRKGIVHYPGTALPGEVGTSYISGHSSGYLWDSNPYKEAFESLGTVADGTSFTITATQKNGKTVKFNYVVQNREEFEADDQEQFISTAESIVALSTCWPVGTTDRRLVLFSKLTQVERS